MQIAHNNSPTVSVLPDVVMRTTKNSSIIQGKIAPKKLVVSSGLMVNGQGKTSATGSGKDTRLRYKRKRMGGLKLKMH
jgi:hypothetical protein